MISALPQPGPFCGGLGRGGIMPPPPSPSPTPYPPSVPAGVKRRRAGKAPALWCFRRRGIPRLFRNCLGFHYSKPKWRTRKRQFRRILLIAVLYTFKVKANFYRCDRQFPSFLARRSRNSQS